MAFATQWGANGAVSEPPLCAVPLRGRSQAFAGRDPRLPQVGQDGALRIHDPVRMAEISGPIGGQLGLVAAQQPVGLRAEAQEAGRDRETDSSAADGSAEGFGELLVGPATG